ncbi:MAG: hypothetical protein JWO49_142 [Arthrobacter sp.]|nr:hypothetical protein [Arthrobacter sp.]
MMQLLMAAALYLLALARVPALLKSGRDPVFVAALLTGTAALLTSPAVYPAVDQALGGQNVAKLVQHTAMMIGMWFIRGGILDAVAAVAERSRRRFRTLPLYLALALQTAFFLATDAGATTMDFQGTYNKTLPGALFYSMVMIFTGWMCAEIAVVLRRILPEMRGPFKVGFLLVATGAFLGTLSSAAMVLDILATAVPALALFSFHQTALQQVLDLVPTVLVGLGLTIPAVAGQLQRVRTRRWEKKTLLRVTPIRGRALAHAGTERTLPSDPRTTVAEQLHRMIVEIWDAELAAGAESVLTAEDRAYLLTVEEKLDLGRSTGGGSGPQEGAPLRRDASILPAGRAPVRAGNPPPR